MPKAPKVQPKAQPLQRGDVKNFQTLINAALDGNLVITSCIDKESGNYVAVLCAVNREPDDGVTLIPLAKMFTGNPYDEVMSPMEVDEQLKTLQEIHRDGQQH